MLNDSIGFRIQIVRKRENLTQVVFAKALGVKQGYVTRLESGKSEPSEQLILGICRAFGLKYEWLKFGTGEMLETARQYTSKGMATMDAIIKKLESDDLHVPLGDLADIVGVDPDNPSENSKLPKNDFWRYLSLLIKVFKEGDDRKIEVVKNMLIVLKPKPPLKMPAQKKRLIDEILLKAKGLELTEELLCASIVKHRLGKHVSYLSALGEKNLKKLHDIIFAINLKV